LIARQDSKQFKGSLTQAKDLAGITAFETQANAKISNAQRERSRGSAGLKIKGFSNLLSGMMPVQLCVF
jgi:hypothetical protein